MSLNGDVMASSEAASKNAVQNTCGVPFLDHGGPEAVEASLGSCHEHQAKSPVVGPSGYPASPARWWIIILFSLAAIAQSMTWNICAPISNTVFAAYGWGDEVISWGANTANIAFMLNIVPMSRLYERKGARPVMLLSGLLVTSCTLLRCLPLTGDSFTTLFFLSMVFNGASGSFLNFGGPLLSELWFPDHQRTMATAIASTACYLGSAFGFVAGPYVVGDLGKNDHAAALVAMQHLLYAEASFAVILFAGIIIYFPSQPKQPPSQAAAQRRADMDVQLTSQTQTAAPVLSHRDGSYAALFAVQRGNWRVAARFWLLVVCMGLPLGVYQAWGSVLNLNLSGGDIKISQTESGMLGFWMTVSGCVGSVVVGALMDYFVGHMKTVIACLLFFSASGFVVFTCVICSVVHLSHDWAVIVAIVSGIAGGFGFNCTIPLFFELSLETVFGVASENAASSILVFFNTIVQIIFLAVPTRINGSTNWMNWLTCASMLGSALALIPFRARYNRMMVDRGRDVAHGCDRLGCL